MKNKFSLSLLSLLLPFLLFSQSQQKDTIRLFYLGGQSNMDGYGKNIDLPTTQRGPIENVWIFHGNPVPDGAEKGGHGVWEILRAGHGAGFSSDKGSNYYSDRFGLELSFAKRIQEYYPGEKIALIKYSRGGTSIDSLATSHFGCWEPDLRDKKGINQYDHFLSTINHAFTDEDINNDGKKDHLLPSGILWMQGESDASYTEGIAMNYYTNLKRLMDLIRAAFRSDDLPVVIGKISDSLNNEQGKVWKYGELVQHGQEKYIRTDEKAAIVRSTKYYKYSDRWHYDSEGYLDLGAKMAEEMYKLMN